MRIYEGESDGVIGELLYQTVEFTKKEFTDKGMGVISQGTVQRYLVEERPDLKIKKLGSFKFDSQENTVTVRIGTPMQKLLGPGYDEIQAKAVNFQREYDAIVVLYDKLEVRYSGLIERYDALVVAVGKDAQKFSAMLVENENLKVKNTRLTLAQQEIDLTSDDENPRPTENEVDKMLEDTADLVPTKEITLKEAKKIMEENEKYPGQYQV